MTKPTSAAHRRSAPKTPITQEDVRRVQSITATKNGGQQSPWVRRLQSKADKRAAGAAPDSKPAGANGGGPAGGQRDTKGSRGAKAG